MNDKVLAGVLAIYIAGAPVLAQAQSPPRPPTNVKVCESEEKVRSIVGEIPKHFKMVRPSTYLIDDTRPGASGLDGKLTVYIPADRVGEVSIFDRRDGDKFKWYNVSNIGAPNLGCAQTYTPLGGPTMPPSQVVYQGLFLRVLDRIYSLMSKR